MITKARVISGNLIYEGVAAFYQQLQNFEGQDVEVEIRKRKKQRSGNQNRFYFGVILPEIREALIDAGYFMQNNEQVHELLKFKFLKATVTNEDTGEIIETLGSTKDMSTSEFETYLTAIRVWAAEYLNVTLSIPNE